MVIDMKRIISIVLFAVAILCSCKKGPAESISFLNVEDTLRLVRGQTYQLQVAVSPRKSGGRIRFFSTKNFMYQPYDDHGFDAPSADVDEQGLITAICIGTTRIQAYAEGDCGPVSTYVNVVVEPNPEEYYNAGFDGRKLVDLGLSVLWCSTNVGTDKIEGLGDLFAWGETVPRSGDNQNKESDYKFYGGVVEPYSKYTDADGLTTLERVDDAVTCYRNSSWARTPTKSEWEELFNSCTRYETEYNGIWGVAYIARNGHQIFLPYPSGGASYASSSIGSHWSSCSYVFLGGSHSLSYPCPISDTGARWVAYSFRGVAERN